MTTTPRPLSAALAAAQLSMSNVQRDRQNPHFKSSYATLGAVRDVVIPALAEQGIAVVQMPGSEDGRVTIRTVLLYDGGEYDCGTIGTVADSRGGNAAQAVGSALTYLRRYALAAVAGVAPEDDDGNASSAPPRRPAPQRPPARQKEDVFGILRERLREAFGSAEDPKAFNQAEEMAWAIHGKGINAVFKTSDPAEAVALLDALEAP